MDQEQEQGPAPLESVKTASFRTRERLLRKSCNKPGRPTRKVAVAEELDDPAQDQDQAQSTTKPRLHKPLTVGRARPFRVRNSEKNDSMDSYN